MHILLSSLPLLLALLLGMYVHKRGVRKLYTTCIVLAAFMVLNAISVLLMSKGYSLLSAGLSLSGDGTNTMITFLSTVYAYAQLLAPFILCGLFIYLLKKTLSSASLSLKWPVRLSIFAAAAVMLFMLIAIFSSSSSTAVIGIIFIPIYAGGAALATFLISYAVTYFITFRTVANLSALPPLIILTLFITGTGYYLYNLHLRNIAKDTATSPETLQDVLDDPLATEGAKIALATNPSISIEMQKKLAHDKSFNVRQKLASNPSLSAEIIALLAHDTVPIVVGTVGKNPSTPVDILEAIVNTHIRPQARSGVADNPNTPVALLEKLVEIPDFTATASDQRQADARTRLYKSYVYAPLARNSNSTPEILEKISHTNNYNVNIALARNPKTPCAVFERLLQGDAAGVVKSYRHYERNCMKL